MRTPEHSQILSLMLVALFMISQDQLKAEKWCFGSFTIVHSDAPNVILSEFSYFDAPVWVQLPATEQGHYTLNWGSSAGCNSDLKIIHNSREVIYSYMTSGGSIALLDNSHYLAFMGGTWMDNMPVMNISIGEAPEILLSAYVNLAGAWDANTGDMRDDLRSAGLLPVNMQGESWHSEAPGSRTVSQQVLDVTGPNAVVDWVRVELKHPVSNDRLFVASGLLKRSGEITAADGVSPIAIPGSAGTYRIVIRHRNHLHIATAPMELTEGSHTLDLRDQTVTLHGSDPMMPLGTYRGMWPGDAKPLPWSNNSSLSYTGANNDRDQVLQRIGGVIPTNVTTPGYYDEDTNMDGIVKYSGSNNDRDIILQAVGGNVPTAVRVSQIP